MSDHRSTNGSHLDADIAFLTKHGVCVEHLVEVQKRADSLLQPAAKVFLSAGDMSEERYCVLLARELGLEFCNEIFDPGEPIVQIPEPGAWDRMARMVSALAQVSGSLLPQPIFFIAPDALKIEALRKLLGRTPAAGKRLRLITHTLGMKHLVARASGALLDQAANGLVRMQPQQSAKSVVSAAQAVALVLLAELLLVLVYAAPETALLTLHLSAALAYLSMAGLRIAAWLKLIAGLPRSALPHLPEPQLPLYSIMVALYDEANQVDSLVNALCQLDWPKERLEIKLICEADDLATIEACRRVLDGKRAPFISVVLVPVSQPRTKPKALNFALPLCSGELLVVYDAEDRPHPGQLREAHGTFETGPKNLACLQAPLSIHNHADGWLPRLFAIEYSAHFDGFLPTLESLELPLPLGGSSNHFKRQALVNIGAWDPYNVTEDADLGIRLCRAGCRTGTLTCPTFEEAPSEWKNWLYQRTRWFKGWYQTWLVHMRQPISLCKQLGLSGFLAFQILSVGAAFSVLVHPFLLLLLASSLIEFASGNAALWKLLLLQLDLFTVLFGFLAWALLAAKTLPIRNLGWLRAWLWVIPIYWLLMSVAAWRALWQLLRQPHKWEKTHHQ